MVDELNMLATTGVEIASRSGPQLIYCTLVAMIADSLASHLVWGVQTLNVLCISNLPLLHGNKGVFMQQLS